MHRPTATDSPPASDRSAHSRVTAPLATVAGMPAWQIVCTVGCLAWIVAVAVLQPSWTAAIFLFAPLVLAPLAARLMEQLDERSIGGPLIGRHVARARWWMPVAAIALAASFALPQGIAAAALAVPWLAVTAAAAALGVIGALARMRQGEPWTTPAVALHVGLVYLLVGGGWTVISRAGLRPLDFSAEIVELTAVHFHYAGLLLPVIAAAVAFRRPGRLARTMVAGVLVGVPLVAVGITLTSTAMEVVAATVLAAACALLASLQLAEAAVCRRPAVLALLGVASMSLLAGMGLAVVYAVGQHLQTYWLDIPTMVRTHGVVNAFGFTLPALLGWRIETHEKYQ